MMNRKKLLQVFAIGCVSLCSAVIYAGSVSPVYTDLFVSGKGGYKIYRIPAIVVSNKGTVLAFCEGRKHTGGDTDDIDTLLRRSKDGGKTWSSPQIVSDFDGDVAGNPCAVVDRQTGRVWLFNTWNSVKFHESKIHAGFGADSRRVFVTYSDDDGVTWAKHKEITRKVKLGNWTWYATGPGAGIQLAHGKNKGRLIIPCDHMRKETGRGKYWSHIIYSDDHGQTWQIGGIAGDMNNECEAVELAGGKVMLNMRSWAGGRNRVTAISNDGGLSFGPSSQEKQLVDPRCQASIRRYSWQENGGQNRLLFLNANSTKRNNITLWTSSDEGKTWPIKKTLHAGPAAYSCLAVLPDGNILCMYEAGTKSAYEKIVLAKVPFSWLTEKPKPAVYSHLDSVFINSGKAKAVAEAGRKWTVGKGFLQGAGTGNYLYAKQALSTGDFQIRARLSIDKINHTAASFVLGGNHFGFDGGTNQIFVEGPEFGKVTFVASCNNFFSEGKPFLFEVTRTGKTTAFSINGKKTWETTKISAGEWKFGFRPWRSTMRVYDLSATGKMVAIKDPPKSVMPDYYTIPMIDISKESNRHVIVAAGTKDVYQGHPTTVLMEDKKTIFVAWTYNHGGYCGPMKKSTDGGLTWSELIDVPDNWKTIRNCPSIHRITDTTGKERLFVFAGNGDMYQSVSEDNGKTWTPMQKNGLQCVVAPTSVFAIHNGRKHLMWVHRRSKETGNSSLIIWQSVSSDGGLTWGDSKNICEIEGAMPCEPCVIKSPDGKQFVMLMRENSRRLNSLKMISNDEGKTWSKAEELTASLTGDRHTARYSSDGRLVIVFRDMAAGSPTKGNFVAWIGTYDDIVNNREGQYRVLLLRQYGRSGDCGYPGLEILPDDTFVATTYVKYTPGPEKNSVVSLRFKLDEIDDLAKKLPERNVLFKRGKGGYNNYRIPSLIVSNKGTLLAFCEGREAGDTGDIDIMLRRSEDGGKNWTQKQVVWSDARNTCGNPCPVVDQDTGRIWLITTWNLGTDHEGDIIAWKSKDVRRPYVCYSDDDGKTWSTPVDISKTARRENWRWYATGPGNGIQILKGRYKGRLVIPANHSYNESNTDVYRRSGKYGYGSHVIYSDDHGKNWKISDSITPGCNESTIAELRDGSLMMNMRSYNGQKCRAISISGDGGATWSPIKHDQTLIESVCQASLISYSNNNDHLLLFSNPANKSGRSKLTVRLSDDNGKTWSVAKQLHAGPAAYSCLTVLPNGDIACFYEGGIKSAYETIIFEVFSMEWLSGAR